MHFSKVLKSSLITLFCYFSRDAIACTIKSNQFSYTMKSHAMDFTRWTIFQDSMTDVGSHVRIVDRNQKSGCMIFGPYASTSGPALIYGKISFRLEALNKLDGSFAQHDDYAMRMDITADYGAKTLVSRNLSIADINHLPEVDFYSHFGVTPEKQKYQILSVEVSEPTSSIEVRMCDPNQDRRFLWIDFYESVLTVNYNNNGSHSIESDCTPE